VGEKKKNRGERGMFRWGGDEIPRRGKRMERGGRVALYETKARNIEKEARNGTSLLKRKKRIGRAKRKKLSTFKKGI